MFPINQLLHLRSTLSLASELCKQLYNDIEVFLFGNTLVVLL